MNQELTFLALNKDSPKRGFRYVSKLNKTNQELRSRNSNSARLEKHLTRLGTSLKLHFMWGASDLQ